MAQARDNPPKLYSPRLLALSASLADYPLLNHLSLKAEARSRTCGSAIAIGLELAPDGGVSRIGMQVSACAVGQSSAAILARDVAGHTPAAIEAELYAIEAWLSGAGCLPAWPGFDALEPALAHSGRHDALLLPWRAAVKALSTPAITG